MTCFLCIDTYMEIGDLVKKLLVTEYLIIFINFLYNIFTIYSSNLFLLLKNLYILDKRVT